MNDSFGFNLDEELGNEVVQLYCTTKTFLYLAKNWPVSEADLDLWNFFAVISQSLWRDIVISVGRLILGKQGKGKSQSLLRDIVVSRGRLILDKQSKDKRSKRNDDATLEWFIDRLKEENRLTVDQHSDLTKELTRLKDDFEPFRRARNKVVAHKDVGVMKRCDPVIVDVDFDGLENLVSSLWSFYRKLSEISEEASVFPPGMGPAGLRQLQYMIREYHSGPYRQISKAMSSGNYASFTAQYDSIENELHVTFQASDGAVSKDIEENDIIQHYANGKLIGLTILNPFR